MNDELIRIPVGVIVERRKAKSEWIEFVWQPSAVLAGIAETAPWTSLTENDEATTFYAGGTEIELFPTETSNYRDNLASGKPLLWVVLRPGSDRPYELFKVTADPAEGEALTEAGLDLVESVAMPDVIAERIGDYVAKYHVERPFIKRERNSANLEALSPKSPAKEK